MRHTPSPLPQWIQPYAEGAAKQPQNSHDHPAGEEALAKDVSGAIERHGPQDQERERHGCSQGFGDGGGAREFGLIVGERRAGVG